MVKERFDKFASGIKSEYTVFEYDTPNGKTRNSVSSITKIRDSKKSEYDAAVKDLEAKTADYEAGIEEYNTKKAEYDTALQEYETAKDEYNNSVNLYNQISHEYNVVKSAKLKSDTQYYKFSEPIPYRNSDGAIMSELGTYDETPKMDYPNLVTQYEICITYAKTTMNTSKSKCDQAETNLENKQAEIEASPFCSSAINEYNVALINYLDKKSEYVLALDDYNIKQESFKHAQYVLYSVQP